MEQANADYIAALNPAAILELIALARAGTAAPAALTAKKVETDMADRLRRIVTNIGEGPIAVTSKLLLQAADECDHFYNGMMNWKASAQAKDRIIIEQREALAAPAAAVEPSEQGAVLADVRKWIVKNRPAITLSRQATVDEYLYLLKRIDAAIAAATPEQKEQL